MLGYHPQVILAGRRINDGMGEYVARQVLRLMLKKQRNPVGARALVLGLTFKENCSDLRNSRVIDVIRGLADFGLAVDVHDPLADPEEARHEYGIALLSQPQPAAYDAVVLAVAHEAYRTLGAVGIRAYLKPGGVLYDVKSLLPRESVEGRL
jgi:UDP-N-acetyl-D-galactosamine dehydrogenase